MAALSCPQCHRTRGLHGEPARPQLCSSSHRLGQLCWGRPELLREAVLGIVLGKHVTPSSWHSTQSSSSLGNRRSKVWDVTGLSPAVGIVERSDKLG